MVTALELLAAVPAAPPQSFLDVSARITDAYEISKGRILGDPRHLLCNDILRIPFPPNLVPPSSRVISRYMDIIRRANSLEQLLTIGVPYRGRRAKLVTTTILADIMAAPKRDWTASVEGVADKIYPDWRKLFQQTRKRLPPEMRKELRSGAWLAQQRPIFIKALLDWLGASTNPEVMARVSAKLDAVLEFTIFVTHEFLLGEYSPEKNSSDVFDMFQLQYLAFDKFVIVTSDPDLTHRTQQSSQADRIMSFDRFLPTL